MTPLNLSYAGSEETAFAVGFLDSEPGLTAETLYDSDRLQPEGLEDDWEIYVSSFDTIRARNFGDCAAGLIRRFTQRYSRFVKDSIVNRINAAAGARWVDLDEESDRLLSLADRVHALTRGIMDPTMLPLVRLWQYRPARTKRPASSEVSLALGKVGWTRVRREPGRILLPESGMCLDLEPILHRHIVDRVVELGREMGLESLLVKHGRDMRAHGVPFGADSWVVGVCDPDYAGLVGRQVRLDGCAASSCGYQAGFESRLGRDWSDVIDPRSGFPVDNSCLQTSVVAKSCLEAGLLATTAYTLGAEQGMALVEGFFGAEGVMSCRGRDDICTEGGHRFFA